MSSDETVDEVPSSVGVIEIGGSHVTAAAIVVRGRVARVHRRTSVTLEPAASADALLDLFVSTARSVPSNRRWAVAIPGPFDYARGVGIFEGVAKFLSLGGVDLREGLARGLGVEPAAVEFVNDASAYGIGESTFGAARQHRRALCITIGTGIGSAFLADGLEISEGDPVPPKGHMHLVSYDGRPLEEFVSSRAITQRYLQLAGATASVKRIAELARLGDDNAFRAISDAMRILGAALSPWIESFEASVVVFGGSVSRSWDLLEGAIRAGVETHGGPIAKRVTLCHSELLDDGPLLGAAVWLTSRR